MKDICESYKHSKPDYGFWRFSEDLYEATDNADALVIITEWNEYREIDWEDISKRMRPPAWVFDTRSVVNLNDIKKTTLNIWSIGNGMLN